MAHPDMPNTSSAENRKDQADVLSDQDQTLKRNLHLDDENMGASTNSLESLEDEPADFMRGDVDVKEQMDRAAGALENSIEGHVTAGYEDSPTGELANSFRNTPGGIEEVSMHVDRDLAMKRRKNPKSH